LGIHSFFALRYAETYAAIVLGVLAATVTQKYGHIHLAATGRGIILMILLLSGVGLVTDTSYEVSAPLSAISIVLIAAIPGKQHRFGDIFRGMSYPLYLNHWMGAFLFNYLIPTDGGSPLRWGASAVFNVSVAIVLYVFIEKRLLNNRNRWFNHTRGYLTTVVAYSMIALGVTFGLFMTV
jgi:peptidoglycan/LPS O-acetylase OafA/YrhL